MILASELKISSMQATIFTPGLSFISQIILSHFLKEWQDVFDDEPISIPSEPNIPPEIPRIILQSKNKQYKIEFSPVRVNIFWLSMGDKRKSSLRKFYKLSGEILCDYRNLVKAKTGRLAAVIGRFIELNNPSKVLVQNFCKKGISGQLFSNIENFEIHSHKRYKFTKKYPVNSWVRFKTGFIGERSSNRRIIIIQQDINTLPEELEKIDYSNIEIESFFKKVTNEFNSILKLFLPLEA